MTTADKVKVNEYLAQLDWDGTIEEAKKAQPQTYQQAMALWMRWKCLHDLYFLGSEVLGLGDVRSRRGKKIVDPKLHRWLCGVLEHDEDKMILIPRRHAKTFWVKVKIIQSLLKNWRSVRIGLYSKTTNLVQAELKSITKMLQTPALMSLFPDAIPPPGKGMRNWERVTSDVLTIKREGEAPQENQIEVYGVGSVVTGKHFDEHFYDDILNEDDARSPEGNRKVIEWYGYAQNIMEPDGVETVTGTPYHYSDLYAYIEQEGIYKHIYKKPAIVNNKPIYSFYTLAMLDRLKKRLGPYLWSTQYMINAIPREEQLFPPPQPVWEGDNLPKEDYTWYITVDPAATVQKYSDETAFCVAAVNSRGWVYVQECFGVKRPGNTLAEIILRLNERYQPLKIGIEFGMQTHLQAVIDLVKSQWEESQHRKIHLPIVPIPIRKIDKFLRINLSLGSWVRQGKVFFHRNLHDLFGQMEKINPNYEGKDDLVDACSMVFQLVDSFGFNRREDPFDRSLGGLGLTIMDLNKDKGYVSWSERAEV